MKDRPNILFIHVDQMHHRAISAYGNRHVKTPAIDRIVKDGCSLMTAYTAMPQCCPARASWYTGRMSSETGVPVNGCGLLADLPDLGQWLGKRGGYECVYAGKWHINGRSVARSFRQIYGSGKGEFGDGAIARACMGFLENYKGDKPFFLNAGFMNPHDCCYTAGATGGQGKFRFAKEIADKLPPLPKNFANNQKVAARTRGWKELDWRYYIYSYYRLVEMVDAEIGRLYDALAGSRFARNTVVIFTADHGDGLGFHGKLSKGYMEEEAWRVPLVIVHPGKIEKGKRDTEHLSIGVDMAATICDYAKVPPLPKMTIAKSLKPIVEGDPPSKWRDYIVGESFLGGGQIGIRDKKHKSIHYGDGLVKVYDLVDDPLEMKDLASGAAGKAVIKRHKGYLRQYVARLELCTRVDREAPGAYKTYLDWYRKVKEEA
ncbi:MAG: sulfatase-like hydrolase/transferase [Phycisphaerae bacterium]|jgi:choline-sulfatase|nr:sulfatase-like hydrolase/transferase [Phycisphaerae bacterium]